MVDYWEWEDLKCHFVHFWFVLKLKDSHKTIKELFGSDEIEVEAKLAQDFLLEVNNVFSLDNVTVDIFKGVYHVVEVGVVWLFELGSDEEASDRKQSDVTLWDILMSNESDISVKNTGTCK